MWPEGRFGTFSQSLMRFGLRLAVAGGTVLTRRVGRFPMGQCLLPGTVRVGQFPRRNDPPAQTSTGGQIDVYQQLALARDASARGGGRRRIRAGGTAGASAGSRAGISPEQAGYIASGAQFKAISAIVYLRNPTQYAGEVAGYRHSVQLWTWDDAVVTFGVRASTSGTRYTPYATIYDRSTHQVIASNPNAWSRNVTNERHPGFRSTSSAEIAS